MFSQVLTIETSRAAFTQAEMLAKCKPLLDAVQGSLDNRKRKVLFEAEGITGGSSLSEGSCVDNLLEFQFDAFALTGISGAIGAGISQLKEEALQKVAQLACDFADDLKAEADEFLSCTATFSVNLEAMGQLPTPDLQSCFGTGLSGSDFGYSYSAGKGSESIGTSFGGSVGTDEAQEKNKALFDSIRTKIDSLNDMGN